MSPTPMLAQTRRSAKWMRKHGWNHRTPDNGLRRRLYDLAACHQPWWDWGHRLMILTGSDMGGNWDEPEPPTWWYRMGDPKHMARTGYPIHPPSTFEVITDYTEFIARTGDLNEDEMYHWRAFCFDQDRQLQVGHLYWGGDFYGMTRWEARLLGRYLRMARRHDWFGLRSWLYSQGLHGAVYRRKPRSCGEAPPRGSGGYDHWLCQLRRGHDGLHRFNNMEWGEIGGEPIGVVYHARLVPSPEEPTE